MLVCCLSEISNLTKKHNQIYNKNNNSRVIHIKCIARGIVQLIKSVRSLKLRDTTVLPLVTVLIHRRRKPTTKVGGGDTVYISWLCKYFRIMQMCGCFCAIKKCITSYFELSYIIDWCSTNSFPECLILLFALKKYNVQRTLLPFMEPFNVNAIYLTHTIHFTFMGIICFVMWSPFF